MTLGYLLSIYKNGYYILSDGKHLLDINNKKYRLCTVKQFSNYRYNTIRIVIETEISK